MNAITMPLKEWAPYEEIEEQLRKKQSPVISISGCTDSQKINMIEALSDGLANRIIVTYSEQRVQEILSDLRLYERSVYSYPAKDLIFYQADIQNNRLTEERIKALKRIAAGVPVTLVTTFAALMTPVLPIEIYKNSVVHIDKKTSVDEKDLAKRLVSMGYVRNYQVESPGQFSVRGGIVDIFDLTEENPYRIELWGDQVESIRSFDIDTQKSIEVIESVNIFTAAEMVIDEDRLSEGLARIEKDAAKVSEKFRSEFLTEEAYRVETACKTLREDLTELGRMVNLEGYINYFYTETGLLTDYFDAKNTVLVLDEPVRIKGHADAVSFEFGDSATNRLAKGYMLPGQTDILKNADEVLGGCNLPVIQISTLEEKGVLLKPTYKTSIMTKQLAPYKNHVELLEKDLALYKKRGYRILLLSASRTRAKRLAEELTNDDLLAIYSDDQARELIPGEITCMYGNALKGFEYPLLKYVVISESDIFGTDTHKKRKSKKTQAGVIKDFGELRPGDYVVHEHYGLGMYAGIEKIETEGVIKDCLKIEYRDKGVLFLLPSNLEVLQKYAAADTAKKPKLSKLGSKEWVNTKSKVKEAIELVADDLVKLYAARQERHGYVYGPDTVWQKEFEEMFPYEETEDQLAAVEDTKRDMESDKIMDRLICGDVGYGKTEIALRAAFKAVSESKQVAVLVPTTILANQHYSTFVQRMKNFPVRIELLSRFKTSAEQKKIIEELKKGMVDIVIGTHRLLSNDVEYKDLGLLVVDEEQRFGVTHKEKIKKIKENVDVLTLTATPIPRTLHMSLVGIRDMSVLEEAPAERLPIQTFVCEFNEEMVREAIVRELSRGGQVYYVYNRVNTIADATAKIKELVPEANVEYAHGQMDKKDLEDIMIDFVNGDIDVLVSTTIIETGLDISNVNTIIIHDSDKMGLSQLYQLRGRVGRSTRTAYAFLMYRRDKMLKEVAEKRLEAIREFTELGSGFKIAMRDLEIRGAGNMLGHRQSGHMEAVGYDLYCKMLNEAVMARKGLTAGEAEFNTKIDLDVDAFIPGDYIVNEVQKLDIYKRISALSDDDEVEEMEEELKDRFGTIPPPAKNLLTITRLKGIAHKVFATEVTGRRGLITVVMKADASVRVEGIPDVMLEMGKGLHFYSKGIPTFTYSFDSTGIVYKDEENLLINTRLLLECMERNLCYNESVE